MELMSPLLLYALLTLVPQALGKNRIGFAYETTNNNSMIIKKRPQVGKNIMLNVNTQANTMKSSDLQTVFIDPSCRNCATCMERAVNAHKIHNHVVNTQMNTDRFQDNTYTNQENIIRERRSVKFDNVPKIEKKPKKSKPKRNKSVSVIKYNENGEIYALKVKETSNQLIADQQNVTKSFSSTTCQVYSVQQSLPCESPEADLILTATKRKTNKKNKKVQGKKETNVPTEKATLITSVFRKRHVDNSQVPENFMTSLEEMY
ncbi:unnamed protein product [Colias eurytheme]|nr:unnamed protein product [Colias eurytheme]